MSNYQYIAKSADESMDASSVVQNYLKKNKININGIVEEAVAHADWDSRAVAQWFNDEAQYKDALVVVDGLSLASTAMKLFAVMQLASQKQVSIHFAKYDQVFVADMPTNALLDLLVSAEHDFVQQRREEALTRRRSAGLSLGRPRGRKNKSLKLDHSREDIMKYLALGISKASIAKLVGCHSQTLYDWMDRHGIEVQKEMGDSGRVEAKVINKDLRNVFKKEKETV